VSRIVAAGLTPAQQRHVRRRASVVVVRAAETALPGDLDEATGQPAPSRARPERVRGGEDGILSQEPTISRMRRAVSDGVLPTRTPAASRASCLACAVPAEPETMAPAWPIVFPSGAVKPAT
jgi:hypothetical protein